MQAVCRWAGRVGAPTGVMVNDGGMPARPVFLAVLAMLLLTACGSSDPGPGRTTPAPGGSATTPLEDLTVTTSPRGRAVTVEGTVDDGVEAGCLVLTTAQETFTLVGDTRELATLEPGTTVTVRGQVRADLMTTCQQGTALWVEEVSRS
jgi:hypothetical protein